MTSPCLPVLLVLTSAFWLMPGPAPLAAQGAAAFEVSASQREVPAGNRFQVTFTLRNAEARSFRPPELQGFRLTGPTENMRGMTMINGKSSVYQSWGLELEALREGTFAIGPATVVTTDGKTLQTQPLNVRVVAPRAVQVPPGADEDLFVTAECTPATAFVGQQVKFQVKVYTRVNIGAWELLSLPKFDGFSSREMKRFDRRPQSQTVRGKKYTVQTLHEVVLFAEKPGVITLDAAQLRLEVEKPGAPLTIFGPSLSPVLLRTGQAKLEVEPLPEPVPDGFSGLVGQYEVKFSTDHDSLTTGDAATFLLEIQGNGDARQFLAPKLNLPANLETFDPKVREEEEFETTDEMAHRKVLEYVIFPKATGYYPFTPEFTFFDPDSNRYLTRRPEPPLGLSVTPGPNPGIPPVDSTDTAAPQTGFWQRYAGRPWLIGGLAAVLLGFFAFLLLRKRRRRPAAPPPPATVSPGAPPMPRTGHDWLANARRRLANDSPRLFFDDLYKALGGWLSARLDVPASALTPELLRRRLTERQAPDSHIESLLQVWRACEQAVFANQYPYLNMESVWRQAEAVVQEMEAHFRRSA